MGDAERNQAQAIEQSRDAHAVVAGGKTEVQAVPLLDG